LHLVALAHQVLVTLEFLVATQYLALLHLMEAVAVVLVITPALLAEFQELLEVVVQMVRLAGTEIPQQQLHHKEIMEVVVLVLYLIMVAVVVVVPRQ
jgi:hypothetical protein